MRTQCQARTRRALPNCHKSEGSCLPGLNQNKSFFLARYKLIFRLSFHTLHHFISTTCRLCSNLPEFNSCWQNLDREVVPFKEQSSLCLGYNDLLHKHSKLGWRAAGEKNKHQTTKPRYLAEFLSLFMDFDRKYLQIFPLSRSLPYLISPCQKDQVAESNFFPMKLFIIGHISAAPDTELVQDANESANCGFVPLHVTHCDALLGQESWQDAEYRPNSWAIIIKLSFSHLRYST